MLENDAVRLTFLGTRGEIKIRSRRHKRHSALLVEHEDARIMIDYGADWLGRLRSISPTAIVLTHAHPDHAGGLALGAPCPVYATKETRLLRHFPISPMSTRVREPSAACSLIQMNLGPSRLPTWAVHEYGTSSQTLG